MHVHSPTGRSAAFGRNREVRIADWVRMSLNSSGTLWHDAFCYGDDIQPHDGPLPGAPRTVERRYVAPFERANREEDYRIAWSFFEAEQLSS